MMWPLYVLGAGAVIAGVAFYHPFIGGHSAEEWFGASIFMAEGNHVMHESHGVPGWVKLSPFVAMLGGLGVAYWFYIADPAMPKALAQRHHGAYRFLLNKWYFDELYDRVFVGPAMWLGRTLWKRGDGAIVDGLINGLSMGVVPWLARLAGRGQSGYVFHYAFVMLIGVSILVTWLSLSGGAH
jgi:NADH-quinone oxidoreductase subunit L